MKINHLNRVYLRKDIPVHDQQGAVISGGELRQRPGCAQGSVFLDIRYIHAQCAAAAEVITDHICAVID